MSTPVDPFDETQPVSLQKPAQGVPPTAPQTVPQTLHQTGGPVLVQIAEIQVTADTVYTPNGSFPVAGSQWHTQDLWTLSQKIPTWAIVCAVVGFCAVTFFSLLFLLVKEDVVVGSVAVTVTNGPDTYTAYCPVGHQVHVADVYNRVGYVRSLAAR